MIPYNMPLLVRDAGILLTVSFATFAVKIFAICTARTESGSGIELTAFPIHCTKYTGVFFKVEFFYIHV